MTLALASRGYLCFRGAQKFGPGPKIIGIAPLEPTIDASGQEVTPTPGLSGAATQGPQITHSARPTQPAIGNTPTITGAGTTVPNIAGSKEK